MLLLGMRLVFVVIALIAGCKRHAAPPVDPDPAESQPQTPTATATATATGTPTATATRTDLATPAATLNGDPRGPRAEDFNRVVERAMPLLRACFDAASLPPGDFTATVHYTVEPPGYTGAVSARGQAPQEALDCCRRVVEALKFPEFRGKKVENDLPVTYQKKETHKTVEIWDAAPKP